MPSDRDSAWLTAQGGSSGTAARKTSTTPTTVNSVGVTASVGDARLTIRSSKSPLSESPLGPSASMGIVWTTGATQANKTTTATTSNLPRIARRIPPKEIQVQRSSRDVVQLEPRKRRVQIGRASCRERV